jgi:serine/threonine-protein kinase
MSSTDSYRDFEATAEAQDSPLAEGFVVDGKYVIRRLLGVGGSGSVYEAVHATIGHRVAIKVVNSSHVRREVSLARFRREAKICGAIHHPHVGQIYDVGELEDGTPFMVMELHEGQSLGDVLHESVMPIAAVIEVARQILAGLAAVHHAGAVHRDVKPDNAMIVRASSGDLVVKLVDFGISKVVRADIRERALTREDIIIGSPDYMAPEQLRGQDVDVRTDLYAVGVLLYEGVTGCVPFDAENLTDLVAAIVRDPVTPPSELRTDCPPELEHLILKAIARDPADRFQSADEMSRQLAHVQRAVRYAADPGLARLQEPMPRRPAGTRRARELAADIKALALAADAAPVAAGAEAGPAKRRRGRLLLFALSGCAALAIAAQLTPPLLRSRDDHRPATHAAAAPQPSSAPLAVVAGAAARAEPPEPVPAAPAEPASAAAASADDTVSKAGVAKRVRRPRARSTRDRTGAEGEPSSGQVDAQSLRALLDEAASAFVLGQMPKARSLYQRVLDRQPRQADAWRGLGLAASRMGQRKDAERAFERYLKLRPNAPDAARIREQLAKLR